MADRAIPVTVHPRRFSKLAPADREAMTALLRSLGHDPDTIAAGFAITRAADGPWHLFLTEYLRNDDGRFYLDPATKEPAVCTHLHEVDVGQLPPAVRPNDEPCTGTRPVTKW